MKICKSCARPLPQLSNDLFCSNECKVIDDKKNAKTNAQMPLQSNRIQPQAIPKQDNTMDNYFKILYEESKKTIDSQAKAIESLREVYNNLKQDNTELVIKNNTIENDWKTKYEYLQKEHELALKEHDLVNEKSSGLGGMMSLETITSVAPSLLDGIAKIISSFKSGNNATPQIENQGNNAAQLSGLDDSRNRVLQQCLTILNTEQFSQLAPSVVDSLHQLISLAQYDIEAYKILFKNILETTNTAKEKYLINKQAVVQ